MVLPIKAPGSLPPRPIPLCISRPLLGVCLDVQLGCRVTLGPRRSRPAPMGDAGPADVRLRDGVALLRGAFGDPPYEAHIRCLRIMLRAGVDKPSIADLSRLMQPMGPDQLAGIADLIHRELPPGKWNAAVRAS